MHKRTLAVQDLPRALTEALERLVKKDEAYHPFVIVGHVPTARFLQFAGSTEKLLYDVPQMGIVGRPCTISSGVMDAMVLVRSERHWSLAPDDLVTLTEDEDRRGLRRRWSRSRSGQWLRDNRRWLEEKVRGMDLLPLPQPVEQ
jgi:hypothetical protein